MPKIVTKTFPPPATAKEVPKVKPVVKVSKPPERQIQYPKLVVKVYCDGEDGTDPPITEDLMKQILGWETESEYAIRRKQEEPGIVDAMCKFTDELLAPLGASVLLTLSGEKIVCWNNNKNRPFDESTAKKYAQDVLQRNWAGPTTMPGETVNGEPIIISKTASVHSGQHRGIGFLIACMIWRAQQLHWKEIWPEQPVFESVVVFGVSDNAKVVRTLDNVKPRTSSDVFYTSGIFDEYLPTEKRECARMLGRAVDMLWKRTGAGGKAGETPTYQTHSESQTFVERHNSILDFLTHIFQENRERAISNLGLSPGQCTAAMYMMACSASDGDVYWNSDPRNESKLDFSKMEEARAFWVDLVKDATSSPVGPISTALGLLASEDVGAGGGRATEKFCVLARAWMQYLEGGTASITADNVKLLPEDYGTDAHGQRHLLDPPDFGGIDLGPRKKSASDDAKEAEPTKEEIEAAKVLIRKKKAEEVAALLQKRRDAQNPTTPAIGEVKVAVVSPTVATPGSGKNGEPGKPPAPVLIPANQQLGIPAKKKPIVRKQ